MKKLTIQAMQQLAESRCGKCLSDSYVNSWSKLLWQCSEGHQWTAVPTNVLRGHWCPVCAGVRRLTIEDMRHLAATRGGRCLSDIYVNAQSELTWQCAKGHQWAATPNNIQQGHWCLTCAGNAMLTIQEMRSLAESRGGKCLSDIYVNGKTPLLWECRAGHRWKAAPSGVKSGKWCSICAGIGKPCMGDIQHLANERGGKCVSHDYRNNRAYLEWECIEGHRWKAVWSSVQGGRWCPECSTGLGERICREFFNQLFRKPFPKSRPKWLVNKAGNQMELDGYCAPLGIAFEHQGEHHYSTKGYFIDSESDLLQRQEDDAQKTTLCNQRGIALVSVPEIPTRLPLDRVRAFIREQLAGKRVPLPQDFDTRDVDINNAYRTSGSREALNHLQRIAAARGGQCLSTSYINDGTKLLWQCAGGHKWRAAPSDIKQGKWCPFCAGTVRKTLEQMQEIAAARGGRCLSPVYEGNHRKLLWGCSQGHRWEATPAHIQQGKWCPKCSGNVRKTMEEMKAVATARGGKCLSSVYKNNKTRLLWQCHAGHTWEAIPSSVRRGCWCPYCSGNVKKTINDMRNLAAQHGGQCLSDEYVNTDTHLLWQCKEGHQWEVIPDSIKRGHWCPVCSREKRRQGRRDAPQPGGDTTTS